MVKKKSKKKANILDEYEAFGDFAYIAGYTDGGVPYGITHDEMEAELQNDETPRKGPWVDVDDEDLPF